MTYSEMQNVAVDGAERHQAEVKTGLAKMYSEGRGIFPVPDWQEEMEADLERVNPETTASLAASARMIYA